MTLTQKVQEAELVQSRYIRCEYRKGASLQDWYVQDSLKQLSRVPVRIQRLMAEGCARIVFFNGPLTDNPEMGNLRGKALFGAQGYTWDSLAGGYSSGTDTAFIGVNGKYIGDRDIALLHELGHLFDFIIGKHVFHRALSESVKVHNAASVEPFPNPYLNQPEEFVAAAFELYYGGIEKRRELLLRHPIIHNFLSDIEREILAVGVQRDMR